MEFDKHLPKSSGNDTIDSSKEAIDTVKSTITNTIVSPRQKHKIRICLGSSCFSKSKERNLQYIEQYLIMHGLKASVDFSGHLCEEHCGEGPILEIDGVLYAEVMPSQLGKILDKHFSRK